MLEGSGLGAAREACCVADVSAAGRAPRQAAQRGQDNAAFARLLDRVAVVNKPPAAVAGELTRSEFQVPSGGLEDELPPITGLVPDGALYAPSAPSSVMGPAATADTAYPRTPKSTGGGKAAASGAALEGAVALSQCADLGLADLKPAPITMVELLDVEAFQQAAVAMRSGGAGYLLRIASEDLGVVQVLVMQTGDGVNIRFVAEQDLTRQRLERQLDLLREALANEGIGLGVIDVLGANGLDAEAMPPELSDGSGNESFVHSRRAPRPRGGRSLPTAGRLDVIV